MFRWFSSCYSSNNDKDIPLLEDDQEDDIENPSIPNSDSVFTCSSITCCCGFCFFVPFFTISGELGGAYVTNLYGSYLLQQYGMYAYTMLAGSFPFITMVGGLGIGALIWGKTTESATKWEISQREKNKPYSVLAFFKSCCRYKEEDDIQPSKNNIISP